MHFLGGGWGLVGASHLNILQTEVLNYLPPLLFQLSGELLFTNANNGCFSGYKLLPIVYNEHISSQNLNNLVCMTKALH